MCTQNQRTIETPWWAPIIGDSTYSSVIIIPCCSVGKSGWPNYNVCMDYGTPPFLSVSSILYTDALI